MWISFYLSSLARWFAGAGDFLNEKSDEWADVYLLGDYVSDAFAWLAGQFYRIRDDVNSLSGQWDNIYYHIDRWIQNAGDILEIAFRRFDLMEWLDNYDDKVRDAIFKKYPDLENFLDSPSEWIWQKIRYRIGLALSVLDRLEDMVREKLLSMIPDSGVFFANSSMWVAHRLADHNFDLYNFINSPEEWFYDRLDRINPDLDNFLRNPVAFIVPRFIAFIKARVATYKDALTDIATEILSAIF